MTAKEFDGRVLVARRGWDGLDLYLAPDAGAWRPIYERDGVWYCYGEHSWGVGLFDICLFLIRHDFEIVHEKFTFLNNNLKEVV